MELTAPVYYKDFRCLADRCRDNCCRTGWEIDVDDETVSYYKSLPLPLRDEILAGLAANEEGVYTICPVNGQCPFLTESGLCSLVIQLGEERKFVASYGSQGSLDALMATHPDIKYTVSMPNSVVGTLLSLLPMA